MSFKQNIKYKLQKGRLAWQPYIAQIAFIFFSAEEFGIADAPHVISTKRQLLPIGVNAAIITKRNKLWSAQADNVAGM